MIFTGTIEQTKEDIAGCKRIGAHELFFEPTFQAQSLEEWLALMEQLRKLMYELEPALQSVAKEFASLLDPTPGSDTLRSDLLLQGTPVVCCYQSQRVQPCKTLSNICWPMRLLFFAD
jgi:hypothetical protein